MKFFYLTILLSLSLFADGKNHAFASNEACKSCHPMIYEEYVTSMHVRSTVDRDPIHRAVWEKHPQNLKKGQYGCGKCHTPGADNLDDMILKGKKAMPDAANPSHNEAVSCAYCHRIEKIEEHAASNTNIITPEEKTYFGTRQEHVDSPFHRIVTEGNEHMRNGNVCIGCHSHKQNKWGLKVCTTDIANELDGDNCVSCHMPQVAGSVSHMRETPTHAFHGFPGAHLYPEMLSEYVDLSLLRNTDGFVINIENRSSHALLLHPLRLAKLKVSLKRANKTVNMKDEVFVRIIGKDGKPAMPWQADETVTDTMIQKYEKRALGYDYKLQQGDTVEVILGYYLVNPKVVGKLGLQNDTEATRFYVLKEQRFEIE